MTGICGHIPGVTCSNCHPWQNPLTVTHPWPPWSSTPTDRYAANEAKQREDAWQSRDANNDAQVRGVLGMGGDLRAEAERMPEVSLEWDVNDEGPPCIDFTCPCGHGRHLCHGPDWITEGRGQAPGVKCDKCGTAWSLYRVRITARIREEADPDTPSGRAFTARDKDAMDAVQAKINAQWLPVMEKALAAEPDPLDEEELKRQLREVMGVGRWSGWVRLDNPEPLDDEDRGMEAAEPLWCPECGHHIDDHHDGVCVTLCECLALPSQIAQALITDAVKAIRQALVGKAEALGDVLRDPRVLREVLGGKR